MSLKSPLSTYMSNSPTVISNKQDGKRFLLDLLEETEFSWTSNFDRIERKESGGALYLLFQLFCVDTESEIL
jgi:hypothetical protein